MKAVLYSLVMGSLMYAQVCTCPDIAFVIGMLDRYLSDPGQSHWKAVNKVLRNVHDTGSHVDISAYKHSLNG